MNNKKGKIIITIILLVILVLAIFGYCFIVNNVPKIEYRVYTSKDGWSNWYNNGKIAGKENNEIKGLEIRLVDDKKSGVKYNIATENIVFKDDTERENGKTAGDLNKSIGDIKIDIYGEIKKEYKIYYRTHNKKYKWTDWAEGYNGLSGCSESPMDQIQIKIVNKNKSFDMISHN